MARGIRYPQGWPNNPAKFQIRSDGTGSVKVNGWYVRVNRRAQGIA